MDKEIVLLTGASSGIGQAVARKLAEAHHTVVMTARRRERLDQLERELAGRGLRAVAIPGDLTLEGDVQKVVAEALKTFGTLHALVHCAGTGIVKPLQDTRPEEFKLVLDTNLTSLHLLLHLLLPHFLKGRHGHVVAISSAAGREGFKNHTAYCASKFGLMGLLAALRKEVRGQGVTVTAICPGATDTEYWDGVPGVWPREKMISRECVADAVLFALHQPEAACVEELVIQPSGGPL